MGKTMPKSKVIWGERRSVTLAGFSEAHFKEIFKLIRESIGPNEYVNEAGIRRAVMQAKQNPKMKNGYVKLGLIGSDLVIRAKEKKFLGDIEIDAVAVKSYPAKVKKYEPIKRELERQAMLKQLDEVEQRKLGREALKTAQRGSGVSQVSEASSGSVRVKPPLPSGPKPVLKPRPQLVRQESESRESESEQQSSTLSRSRRQSSGSRAPQSPQPVEAREQESEELSAPRTTPQTAPPTQESEAREREVEETREELDRLEKEAEALRKSRLRNVMNRKDESGDTLRDRLLRAAQKAQQLGIGDYAQAKLKAQGLRPMEPMYHGEVLDHQQNRYGRYLKPLKDVFDKAEPGMSFSQWLDAVEQNRKGVKGVAEALELTSPEIGGSGKIVQSGGTVGGLMIYLDDESRKPYAATVSKGNVTGGKLEGTGQVIFVIGPDNKVYIGRKGRAGVGQRGAFNHSSFFSGGPVKSAGSLKLSGSRITEVSEESGHYAPTRDMVQSAVRKFAGGDKDWLNAVKVRVGRAQLSGAEFLSAQAKASQEATWGKYSAGDLTTSRAARLLEGQDDGAWLVWQNGTHGLYLSHNKGGPVTHVPIEQLGAQGLERKKLLTPEKLAKLTPSTPPARRPSTSRAPQESQSTESETTESTSTDPQALEDLKNHPAYHAGIDSQRAGALLLGRPDGAFLLRLSRQGVVAVSFVQEGQVRHSLLDDRQNYTNFLSFSRTNRNKMVRP
jgi:hypothetical protein